MQLNIFIIPVRTLISHEFVQTFNYSLFKLEKKLSAHKQFNIKLI